MIVEEFTSWCGETGAKLVKSNQSYSPKKTCSAYIVALVILFSFSICPKMAKISVNQNQAVFHGMVDFCHKKLVRNQSAFLELLECAMGGRRCLDGV